MSPRPVAARDDGAEEAEVDAAAVGAMIEQVLGRAPRPIAWAELNGEQAAEVWLDLDEWVRWLTRTYALDHRDVPPCWYSHSDLVEELSALWTAHRAAYDKAGAPTGPADWHQILAVTRSRLQLWAARTGCRHDQHRTPSRPGWAADSPPAEYQNSFLAHVTDDAAARG